MSLSMDSTHMLLQMKHFVKSSDSLSTSSTVNNIPEVFPKAAFVSGTDAKRFYEKTVGKEALESTCEVKVKEDFNLDKSKLKPKLSKIAFNVNVLMKAVETGITKDVQAILEQNKKCINCQDQFGWTPLMVACCAGNLPMVQLLLQWKPDLSVTDKKGNTCRVLATTRGHQAILAVLNQYMYKTLSNKQQTITNQSLSDSSIFYCKLCKENIKNTTLKKHLSSTTHNFHSASKHKMKTFYGIPESNKGFQILVKSGWNKEDGLGPCGEGKKFPPKTILKQDRTGLGAKQYKARVTHVVEDTRKETRLLNMYKRDLKSEKINERRQERRIRKMLS